MMFLSKYFLSPITGDARADYTLLRVILRRTKGEVDLKKKSLRTKISKSKSATSLSDAGFF